MIKREIKMAWYWPSSFYACSPADGLRQSRGHKVTKNKANIQDLINLARLQKFSKNGEFLDYMEIDLRIAWANQIILDSAQAVQPQCIRAFKCDFNGLNLVFKVCIKRNGLFLNLKVKSQLISKPA